MSLKTCGLLNQLTSTAMPMKKIRVRVTICNSIASVTLNMVYKNRNSYPVDADFVFPMDDDSAVYQFEVDINGRHIVGECQEKEQAEATHKAAKEKGYNSFLLKEADSAGDIFHMSIGKLPKKSKAKIQFSYVIGLKFDDQGAINYVLPALLNPRYTPSSELHKRVALPKGSSVKHAKLDFEAQITGQLEVVKVTSNLGGLKCKRRDSCQVLVSLTKKFKLQTDLNIHIWHNASQKIGMVLGKGNPEKDGILKKNVIMLNFFPNINKSSMASNAEFIFIVDRSGSMLGSKIIHVKEALLFFLKSLPDGCYFNIISFGSNFDILFPQSRVYDAISLKEATVLQKIMGADMGGTEILRPLEHMYTNIKPKEGMPQQVFLLTDGEVSNTRDVIELVKQHNQQTRVFTIGIGTGASTALVKGVARAGNGKAIFITQSEKIEEKVISCLELAMQPNVSQLKLEWESVPGSTIVTLPDPLPMVFAGEHLVIYGLLEGETDDAVSISAKLSGQIGDIPLEEKISFTQGCCDINDLMIHRLSAKAQIKLLEDSENYNSSAEVKSKIILISMATNIASKYTAFVGVDSHTNENVMFCNERYQNKGHLGNQSIQRYSKTMWTRGVVYFALQEDVNEDHCDSCECSDDESSDDGWISPGGESVRKIKSTPPPVCQHVYCSDRVKKEYSDTMALDATDFEGKSQPETLYLRGTPSKNLTSSTCEKQLHVPENLHYQGQPSLNKIISLQAFDGSWKLESNLAEIWSFTVSKLEQRSPLDDSTVWATALVLMWLRKECSDQESKWKLLYGKSMKWLESQTLKSPHTVQSILDTAGKVHSNLSN